MKSNESRAWRTIADAMVKVLPGGPGLPQASSANGASNATRPDKAGDAPAPAPSGTAPLAVEPAVPSGFRKVIYSQHDQWLGALAQCLTADGRPAPGAWSAVLSLLRSVSVRSGDAKAAQSDLTHFVNTALKASGALSLKAVGGEGQKGLSGAPVMLVRAPSGKPVAVAKVFTRGTDEFVAELSALERLAAVRPDMAVRALAAARTELAPGTEAGVLVMSLAEGCPFDDLMLAVRDAQKGAPERLKTAVEGLGGVLAELHTAEPAERAPEDSVRRHAVALEQILEKCKPHGDLLREQFGFDLQGIAGVASGLTRDYLRDPGPVGLIHGDANPGNFFWKDGKGVTLIDVATLHAATNREGKGIGVRARDVGNLVEKLHNMGRGMGFSPEERREHVEAFLRGYKGRADLPPPHAVDFFRMRAAFGEVARILGQPAVDLTDPELRSTLQHHLDMVQALAGGVR